METVELLINEAYIKKAQECVKNARSSIDIMAYTWNWYPNNIEKPIQQFNATIVQKVNDNVRVRAITNGKNQRDSLCELGIKARTYPSNLTMHTKAILIDEKLLLLGSHNLTDRGTAENHEISVLIDEPDVTLQFMEYFNNLWLNYGV